MADLYEGLALPTPKEPQTQPKPASDENADNGTQRKRAEPTASAQDASETSAKRPKTDADTDIASVIVRLKTHMLVDKKFAKAAPLFQKLVSDTLNADNSSLFLGALRELIAIKGASWSGKDEFAALVSALVDKQSLFGDDHQKLLALWRVVAVTHSELVSTDDSFQFSRACKEIKAQSETTLAIANADEREAELALLVPLLRSLFQRHGLAWAKPMVESVLNICTRERLRFSETQREQVDAWTTAMRDRRHAAGLTRSAATDARRNIVVIDDVNASQAKPKVGRSNHPLFNRDASM